jgi:S1-C subfamily serine protease
LAFGLIAGLGGTSFVTARTANTSVVPLTRRAPAESWPCTFTFGTTLPAVATLLVAVLITSLLTGCGQSLHRAADPTPGRHDRRCRGDLILVDVHDAVEHTDPTVSAPGLTDRAGGPITSSAIDVSRRFTVATRAIRHGDSGSWAAGRSATDAAAAASNDTLVEGTGVIIDAQGLILTNHHVVRQALEVTVWIPQKGWVPARVVGADPLNDLAVLSIDGPLACAAHLADTGHLRLGQPVVAVGFTPGVSPEQGLTTLTGHLTSLGRSLQTALDPTQAHYYGNLLESTVPLSPGHSGGALIDATGAVVGINTAAVTLRSTGRRVGYAIPMSEHVRGIVARLARGESIEHGYLGVLVCSCGTNGPGVLVEEVIPDSPAAAAGLQQGDTIVTVGHSRIRTAGQLVELIHDQPVGRGILLGLSRGGVTVSEMVTLSPRH